MTRMLLALSLASSLLAAQPDPGAFGTFERDPMLNDISRGVYCLGVCQAHFKAPPKPRVRCQVEADGYEHCRAPAPAELTDAEKAAADACMSKCMDSPAAKRFAHQHPPTLRRNHAPDLRCDCSYDQLLREERCNCY